MSGGEILVILIVFLLLFGPDKIPSIARTLGSIMRQVNQATNTLKDEITKEVDVMKDSPSPTKSENNNEQKQS